MGALLTKHLKGPLPQQL